MIRIVINVILIVNIPMVGMGKRADILVRFGLRVRELRQEQGYSPESVAAACGLDRTCPRVPRPKGFGNESDVTLRQLCDNI